MPPRNGTASGPIRARVARMPIRAGHKEHVVYYSAKTRSASFRFRKSFKVPRSALGESERLKAMRCVRQRHPHAAGHAVRRLRAIALGAEQRRGRRA